MSLSNGTVGTLLPTVFPVTAKVPNDIDVASYGQELRKEVGRTLLIIDSRALDRECFAQSLVAHGIRMEVVHCGSIAEFKSRRQQLPSLAALILNVGGRRVHDRAVAEEIKKLVSESAPTPVILLADTDELPQVLKALDCGVRGFIPTSVGIEVCIEAIGLAAAGGMFVPASSVLAMRGLVRFRDEGRPIAGLFTLRQAEVVEALRQGKANKIIAYELNLRESTVKVHIRNIMRKLKARNRTEVAFKINDLFPE